MCKPPVGNAGPRPMRPVCAGVEVWGLPPPSGKHFYPNSARRSGCSRVHCLISTISGQERRSLGRSPKQPPLNVHAIWAGVKVILVFSVLHRGSRQRGPVMQPPRSPSSCHRDPVTDDVPRGAVLRGLPWVPCSPRALHFLRPQPRKARRMMSF